jgi:hypothetical protein
MRRSLCERVALPVLALHRKTSSPTGTVVLAAAAAVLGGYGLAVGSCNLAWLGGLFVVIGWYGFLLHGCDRLLAAKEADPDRPPS